jgi:hypothetical protein
MKPRLLFALCESSGSTPACDCVRGVAVAQAGRAREKSRRAERRPRTLECGRKEQPDPGGGSRPVRQRVFDVRADSRSAGNARLTLVAPTHVWLLIARSTPAQRTAVLSALIATCASSRRAVCWRLRSCRRRAQAVGTDRDCCFTQVRRQLRADGSIGSLVLVRQDSLDVDDGLACAGAGADGLETPG